MATWQSFLVVAASLVFAAFLLVQMRPGTFAFARPPAIQGLREILARARSAGTSRERAQALCDAGDLAAADPRHQNAAVGYFLRAMRLDPSWEAPVERVARSLERRPRALERLLWKRLAAIPWEGDTRNAAARIAEALAGARRRPGATPQREVLRKLASALRNPPNLNDR